MTAADNASDAIGVIIPPQEVRNILETTASFVGRKPALENKVRQRHQNDARFMFLHATDPYHAYFRKRVAEVRADIVAAAEKPHADPTKAGDSEPVSTERKGHDADAGRAGDQRGGSKDVSKEAEPTKAPETPVHAEEHTGEVDAQWRGSDEGSDEGGAESDGNAVAAADGNDVQGLPDASTTQGAAVISFLKSERAKAEALRPEPAEPPPDDVFTLPAMNPLPTALALDVMKLCAQYAARFGDTFVSSIAQRESRNPLFDFLMPMHPHFVAFQRLIDAYKLIIAADDAKRRLVEQLERQAASPNALMDEVWYLHDWECQKAEREHEAELDEKEKVRIAQIDWHDFAVLATVDFDADEIDSLPTAVVDARQLPKMLAAAQKAQMEMEKNRGDVDMDIDEGSGTGVDQTPDQTPVPAMSIAQTCSVGDSQMPTVPSVRVERQRQQPTWPTERVLGLAATGAPVREDHVQHTTNKGDNHPRGHEVFPQRGVGMVDGQPRGPVGIRAPVQGMMPKDARVELGNVDSDIPANLIRRQEGETSKLAGKVGGEVEAGIRVGRGNGTEAGKGAEGNVSEATVVLPSGQRVPLSKAEASMRAELLDPSYKKERERAAEKNRKQNLAGGDEVARNLARLEQARHDGGVYNRADLQEALSGRRQVSEAVVDARVRKAAMAGPMQPGKEEMQEAEEEVARPVKRARVEAAVGALSRVKKSEAEEAEDVAREAAEREESDKTAVEAPAGLMAADEWVKKQGNVAKVRIKVTKHGNKEWKLQGQEMEMSAPLKSTVSKLKKMLSKYTKLPGNKQKLQMDKVGFLKDAMTLAFYNVGDGTVITLEVKERGGRKKH